MSVLLAREFAPSRFEKVLVFRARKNGTGPLAAKWHGSPESAIVRQAAAYFVAEPAAVEINFDLLGRKYRATKF